MENMAEKQLTVSLLVTEEQYLHYEGRQWLVSNLRFLQSYRKPGIYIKVPGMKLGFSWLDQQATIC